MAVDLNDENVILMVNEYDWVVAISNQGVGAPTKFR